MDSYLGSKPDALKNLVRFHYADKEEVFDLVSYQKGGRILNMMRNYLGDKVFFKGLNIYLKQNALKNGEAHQLRLAMEEASGQDLNWFFNQWYFNAGHPELSIDYAWDENAKTEKVTIKQLQKGHHFRLPMAVDIYTGNTKKRYQITLVNAEQSFSFPSSSKPDLVNVDADKVLLATKMDNKPLSEFVFQYQHAPLYADRLEAIIAAAKNKTETDASKILLAALNDKYYGLRIEAIEAIDLSNAALAQNALPLIQKMAVSDPNTLVQAQAITAMASLANPADLTLFRKGLDDKSYAVQGASLTAISLQNPEEAMTAAKKLEKDNRKALTTAMVNVYSKYGSEKELPFISEKFSTLDTQDQVQLIPAYMALLGRVNDLNEVKKGVDVVKAIGIKYKTYGANTFVSNFLGQLRQKKQSDRASLAYIDAALAELK